ncbi:hypothetical protein ACHAQC_007186 [Fusarium culmorum]
MDSTIAICTMDSSIAITEFIMILVWTCLANASYHTTNILYAKFFTSLELITQLAHESGLQFAPGLLDIVQAPLPVTIRVFKSLPAPQLGQWGVYVIVLKKHGHRPKVYVGSGTSKYGVHTRLNLYTNGLTYRLPVGIVAAMEDGWMITHQGLLCWILMPAPALFPLNRLLFLALEATFGFAFWAMDSNRQYVAMDKVCLWHPSDLEYDGICSHSALSESVRADFDLTEEELTAHAAEREKRARELHAINGANWHYAQMAYNYDEYSSVAYEKNLRHRAEHPRRHTAQNAKYRSQAVIEKRYRCEECDISYTSMAILTRHYKTDKHKDRLLGLNNSHPFRCYVCNSTYPSFVNLCVHNESKTHKKNVAAAIAAGQTVHPDAYKLPAHRTKGINPKHSYIFHACTYSTDQRDTFLRHQKSPTHKQKTAVFESAQAAAEAAVTADSVGI